MDNQKKQNWLPKGQIGKNISFEHWVSTKNTNSGHFQGMEEARVGVLGDDQKKSGLGGQLKNNKVRYKLSFFLLTPTLIEILRTVLLTRGLSFVQ